MTLEERIKDLKRYQVKHNYGELDYLQLEAAIEKSLLIIQELQNKNKELTRLEVIDESGRVYVNNSCKMELSYQDEGRTLKIFVNNEDKNIC